ncbi:aspartic proteinase Asp1-like isoform X2 [Solanum dulcamara]|uniref:aspartic proteinase Asp1-like isoform X2 n=1 Tax=Solanum dulcamara TaxID=45834 RepID=UPI002485EE4B|nr:aspartic proteinase Asp1-like isoform X2 [Solanum dulcamara]
MTCWSAVMVVLHGRLLCVNSFSAACAAGVPTVPFLILYKQRRPLANFSSLYRYYQVTLNVGQPPKPYFLDIDTGSDLTWLQCDAPCVKCVPAPHSPYKPNKNVVKHKDPICASLHSPANPPRHTPDDQCDYEVEYADQCSSLGVLVRDAFPVKFSNGSSIAPPLVFGCGYDQEVPASAHAPYTDGILGLGNGKSSLVSQMSSLGFIRNVVGHCLSGQGGGFLFFGDDVLPSSGIVWTPIVRASSEQHYSLGPADLLFGGQATGIKGLPIILDSGSTFTYFNSEAYKTLLSSIKKNIDAKQLTDAVNDKSLPVCWKGSKPFKSIKDATRYFKPLTLSFTQAKNIQLQLTPEAYLIHTDQGNVCLGILNGSEVGLGNINIIGDISMLDKMVIYDNEKQQIGWVPANCNKLPSLS